MGERKLKGEWVSSAMGSPATSVPRRGAPGTLAEPEEEDTMDLAMELRLATELSVSLA